jgi:hypothetical protein
MASGNPGAVHFARYLMRNIIGVALPTSAFSPHSN